METDAQELARASLIGTARRYRREAVWLARPADRRARAAEELTRT